MLTILPLRANPQTSGVNQTRGRPVFEGRELLDPDLDHPQPPLVETNSSTLNIGGGASEIYVNVGGNQINLLNISKETLLETVKNQISASLNQFDIDALHALNYALEGRVDIRAEEVEAAASQAISTNGADRTRLDLFRNEITAGVLGGLLVEGIVAAIAAAPT